MTILHPGNDLRFALPTNRMTHIIARKTGIWDPGAGNMSDYGRSPQQETKKSGTARLAELGPAWIGALAALLVALTGAGFFAGRVTTQPAPQPTVTSTATVTATPTVTVTATPVAGASGSQTSEASSGSISTTANGTALASYTFTLPQYDSAPLGTTAPDQAQVLSGTGQDVVWNTGAGGSPLETGGGDKLLNLPSGSTPTYQTCTTDTLSSGEVVNPTSGNAFCLIEATGKMAGVTITSANNSQSPYYLVLHVVIWENSPS